MNNSKYNLGFISDENLFNHVKETLGRFEMEMTLKKFEKNIIDPVKLLFEMHAYETSPKSAIEREIARQIGKTAENAIGWFHQYIFRHIDGWEVPKDGVDVVNSAKTIFGEIKNKHNTMNSSSAEKVFEKLKGIVVGNPSATAYLIEIIAKKSQDVPWHIAGMSLAGKKAEKVRRISIDRFYEIATGRKTAFHDLCEVLGMVIDDVLAANPATRAKDTIFKELAARNPDIIKGLFLSSFSGYLGFEDFNARSH